MIYVLAVKHGYVCCCVENIYIERERDGNYAWEKSKMGGVMKDEKGACGQFRSNWARWLTGESRVVGIQSLSSPLRSFFGRPHSKEPTTSYFILSYIIINPNNWFTHTHTQQQQQQLKWYFKSLYIPNFVILFSNYVRILL